MKFVLLYRGGNPPQDKLQQYYADWGTFVDYLKKNGIETSGQRVMGGKRVTQGAVEDYTAAGGDVLGVSIIEAESLDKAVEIAQDCPSLPYGGTVDVLKEMAQ